MKNVVINSMMIIFALAGLNLSCGRNSAQPGKYAANDTIGTPKMEFREMEHNFGVIEPDERVGCIFTFRNSGDADLIIYSAVASCGCTAPKYEKKPVPPQGEGSIEVQFDATGRSGLQTKTVVVQSNAENKMVILRIIADIRKEKTK